MEHDLAPARSSSTVPTLPPPAPHTAAPQPLAEPGSPLVPPQAVASGLTVPPPPPAPTAAPQPTMPPAPVAPLSLTPQRPMPHAPVPEWAPAPDAPELSSLIQPVPAESPRRSRGLLFALLAAVTIVVLAMGAVFALRGESGDDSIAEISEVADPSVDPAAYSLHAAAQDVTAASTIRYEVNMSMGGFGALTIVGGVDTEAQIMTQTMDVGSFLGGESGPQEIEVILDLDNGVMYMSNAGFGIPTDAAWISMDLGVIAETSGMSLEDFQNQFTANPFDVAALFTEADEVVDLGLESIDGVEVRHYAVSIDTAAALAANPVVEDQADLGELAELPSEIVYDVWVTADNQIRRMTFGMDVLGQELVMEMNVFAVGEPLDVEIPPPGDVMDATDLVGS